MNIKISILLFLALLFSSVRPALAAESPGQQKAEPGEYSILIDKSDYRLYLIRDGKTEKEYPVAVGKNPGQKQRAGDMTTPTGNFTIEAIKNASWWTHDFKDGKGEIEGAYGPWFLALKTGWKGIGIHGTHNPSSIGTRATEGCIRMHNRDIEELKGKVRIGTRVTIQE